ncbi:uncharacterized protein GLRG_07012 [Colletotrichum graminicola M1.001]|uniref:Uncharacterized protein n=1 Tax=Colletotrichum graminicola (strain M1.001 / M2 / FGSC 10212) TaxID=645133 RepID=E3QLY0_COLGM|nr:uncharacterized protein GLRG_07012 [Colletotrichum graminicola M1.001]EFQ31868.1 hypothetical protein GLRG_07012 [Colletotrichum graminicola M1.001]
MRGSPSPSGLLRSQQPASPFTDAQFAIIETLRSQPMPDTPTPLSRHSMTPFARPLKPIALPKNTSLAQRSFSEKTAGPQPSLKRPVAAASKEDAYRPVTSIPCQDPGSRYRPGRIIRSCEERSLPDRRLDLVQAGSADKMIAGPILSNPPGGAKTATMEDLAREAVLGPLFRVTKTPLSPGDMQLPNMLREKRSTGQAHEAYHVGFSPGTEERLDDGLVSRVNTESPNNKGTTPRQWATQETPGKVPLEKEADLRTQMDYYLYFNAPTVGTPHPLAIAIICRDEL